MTSWTRRTFLIGAAALPAACSSQRVSTAAEIDREVAASRNLLFSTVPGTQDLAQRASGVLIIPDVLEAGFVASGAYGEGALQIGPATVEYYSVSSLAIGFQIGAQNFSQALFFMTPQALRDFRVTDGWQLGVDAEVTVIEDGASVGASTNTVSRPIYEVIYGQRGLIVGASLEGSKYSRLIR